MEKEISQHKKIELSTSFSDASIIMIGSRTDLAWAHIGMDLQ